MHANALYLRNNVLKILFIFFFTEKNLL